MAKRFSDLFSESWKEYKENYKFFLLVIFLFLFIPSFIYYFLNINLMTEIVKLGQRPSFEATMGVISAHPSSFAISSFFNIIVFLLSVFCTVVLTIGILNKKKLIDFKDSLKKGKENYLRSLWFSIVIGVFLIGLTILLVIPGIIFGIFWCFSFFIFLSKRKNVRESLKESHMIVKGKWWGTFGYVILIFLICFLVMLAFTFIAGILNIIINPGLFTAQLSRNYSVFYSSPIWYVNDIVSMIFSFFANVVTIPLMILFMKNLYLDRSLGKK